MENLAATWINRDRILFRDAKTRAEYKAINRRESFEMAEAVLSPNFIDQQQKFFRKKGKTKLANSLWIIKNTRPLWSRLL